MTTLSIQRPQNFQRHFTSEDPKELPAVSLADKVSVGSKNSIFKDTVKGVGHSSGRQQWDIEDDRLLTKAVGFKREWTDTVLKSHSEALEGRVRAPFSDAFQTAYPAFMYALESEAAGNYGKNQLNKSFTAATTGTGVVTGLVPYNLERPTMLIYQAFTPFRNRLPRVQGQGLSVQDFIITGISGTQTGGADGAPIRISIPEIPNGQTLNGNWPLNQPPAGKQTKVSANVPYKWFGMSENTSWIAQFAGQGYDDIVALAALVLLQETMLAEEYAILSGTAIPLSVPEVASAVGRAAVTGETPMTFGAADVYIGITATNIYGETEVSTIVAATGALTSGTDVVDVVITPVPGAYQYNIYAATGATLPTRTGVFIMAPNVGATKFTLQGPVPTAGSNPPVADSGTSSVTDYEGMLSVLSGLAQANSATTGYPGSAGFEAGYINQSALDVLSLNVLTNASKALWDAQGAFRANPKELVCEGTDASNLSTQLLENNAAGAAYRFFIDQSEVGSITAGGAVSEFQNPITRSLMKVLVHPWLPQGTAFLMTYQLDQAWSHITNVWENNMLQDYVEIQWPVIDMSFRSSAFFFGTLFCRAPQYCGLIQGLQKTTATQGGTWS